MPPNHNPRDVNSAGKKNRNLCYNVIYWKIKCPACHLAIQLRRKQYLNKKRNHYIKCKDRNNPSKTMNNHGNSAAQKENEKRPETKLKIMKDYNLNDQAFNITVMKKLNDIEENSEVSSIGLRRKNIH